MFWHDDCLEHDAGEGLWELPGSWPWLDVAEPHPETAARLRTFRHALTHGPVAPHLKWHEGRHASVDELLRVHTAGYLDSLRVSERVALEVNTVVGPETWRAASAAAGTALAALESGAPVAYALVRPPGHHAQPDMADGYCFVNNAALVAETARRRGMPGRRPGLGRAPRQRHAGGVLRPDGRADDLGAHAARTHGARTIRRRARHRKWAPTAGT